jgi:hypothetical protein
MRFPHDPKEIATEVPSNYKPLDYFTRSLQHTYVKNTWDETPINRLKAMETSFADFDKVDRSAYVASGSEPENETADMGITDKPYTGWSKNSSFNMMSRASKAAETTGGLEVDFPDEDSDDNLLARQRPKKLRTIRRIAERQQDKRIRDEMALLVDDDFRLKDFKPDLHDSRFTDIYDTTDYKLDPTDNQFRKDKEGNRMVLSKRS